MKQQQINNLKRRKKDLIKLRASGYVVKEIFEQQSNETKNEFEIDFNGPIGSLYADGAWKIRVTLPPDYPFKSPSIGFINPMFHPNVDFDSGSICLDVINQTWTPMYELVTIFDVFLPQLLRYPNPSDPLNMIAANLMKSDQKRYKETIQDYIKKHSPKKSKPNLETMKDSFILVKRERASTCINDLVSLSDKSQLSELSEEEELLCEDDIFT